MDMLAGVVGANNSRLTLAMAGESRSANPVQSALGKLTGDHVRICNDNSNRRHDVIASIGPQAFRFDPAAPRCGGELGASDGGAARAPAGGTVSSSLGRGRKASTGGGQCAVPA